LKHLETQRPQWTGHTGQRKIHTVGPLTKSPSQLWIFHPHPTPKSSIVKGFSINTMDGCHGLMIWLMLMIKNHQWLIKSIVIVGGSTMTMEPPNCVVLLRYLRCDATVTHG
jgi:hypothetical protein